MQCYILYTQAQRGLLNNSAVLFCIIDDKHLCIKSETPIAQHFSNTSTIKRNLTTHSADCSFQKKMKEIKKKIWIVEYLIVALTSTTSFDKMH